MAKIARLIDLESAALERRHVTPEQKNLLNWADCLLRAERPSARRVVQCILALEASFGL